MPSCKTGARFSPGRHMSDYLLIDTPAALAQCCNELASSQWLAVDTEFERVNTYYPKLCLVQLASAQQSYIVDPILLDDIGPLIDLLYNTSITKVLHSAHQDLEIFFNLTGNVPSPLYDTQLAAPLYNYNKGIGYGNLVKEALDIDLEKGHARTDWTRRPLKDAQLRYAADDVIYLARIYQLFQEKQQQENAARLEQLFSVLYKPETYLPDPERMWKKIFAARRLKGKSLDAVKRLAAWRELTAREQNLPRKWLLADHALVEIAKRLPTSVEEFTAIDKISDKMARRYASAWMEILSEYR
ncbi:MAG: HRDC domain-containing protein [Gammaproteobacteria bacterium]